MEGTRPPRLKPEVKATLWASELSLIQRKESQVHVFLRRTSNRSTISFFSHRLVPGRLRGEDVCFHVYLHVRLERELYYIIILGYISSR